eukprot:gene14089-16611_t
MYRRDRHIEFDNASIESICRKVRDRGTFNLVYAMFDRPSLFKVESCFKAAVKGGNLDVAIMLYNPDYKILSSGEILGYAIKRNHHDMVTYLWPLAWTKYHMAGNFEAFKKCSALGHIPMIQRFLDDPTTTQSSAQRIFGHAVMGAYKAGNVQSLRWVLANIRDYLPTQDLSQTLSNPSAINAGAHQGSWEFFQIMLEQHCYTLWDVVFERQISYGNKFSQCFSVEMLQWVNVNCPKSREAVIRRTLEYAINSNNIPILRWLRANSSMKFDKALEYAISYRMFDTVRYLHKECGMSSKMPVHFDMLSVPLEMLDYLIDMFGDSFVLIPSNFECGVNLVPDPRWIDALNRGRAIFCMSYLKLVVYNSNNASHFQSIYKTAKNRLSHPVAIDTSLLVHFASKFGRLDILKHIVDNPDIYGRVNNFDMAMSSAIVMDRLDILQYLIEVVKCQPKTLHLKEGLSTTRIYAYLYTNHLDVMASHSSSIIKTAYNANKLSTLILLSSNRQCSLDPSRFKMQQLAPSNPTQGYLYYLGKRNIMIQ